jgi:hypothetical protein
MTYKYKIGDIVWINNYQHMCAGKFITMSGLAIIQQSYINGSKKYLVSWVGLLSGRWVAITEKDIDKKINV